MSANREAILALADGRIFRGRAFGAIGESVGEAVFNTAMTGYQEVLTDPSYKGQIVCMTYPEIGNVGINAEDAESAGVHVEGFVVKEYRPRPSNWRSEMTLGEYLERAGVVGIEGIDTRALVRHIRKLGALRGIVATDGTPADQLIYEAKQLPLMAGQELAGRVSCAKPYDWQKGSIDLATSPWAEQMGESGASPDTKKFKVVAYDYGIKLNILRLLVDHHCDVTVVPAHTSAEDVLAMRPTGVFLSNGPGDPEPITYAVENIRKLAGRVPVFGICLGHQLCGLALGGKTFKLKFGHHGSNHPVKNLLTSQVEITAQNHGFCVDPESLPSSDVEITHVNLNDHTNEGMRHKNLPLFSVQYHPEASPGPHDSHYLFTQFTDLMKEFQQPGSSRR